MAQLFSRLLLATEHGDFDVGAERTALALAQRCQLPLAVILPLLSNPEYEALAPQIAARAEREAAGNIARLRAQADAVAVTVDLRLRRGEEPYREIVAEALARGDNRIGRALLGGVAQKVIGLSEHPVLVLHV